LQLYVLQEQNRSQFKHNKYTDTQTHKTRQRAQGKTEEAEAVNIRKTLQDCSAHPLTTMSCFFKQACMNILSQYGSNMAQIEETHSEKQWTKQTKILGKSSPLGKNQEFRSKISIAILQTIP
jgi:hypothetical protein